MKKAPAAAVEDAEDKTKHKYPRTVTVMKPHGLQGQSRAAFRDRARKHC